jgi:multicomponent K+:H+ antiporter subunit F
MSATILIAAVTAAQLALALAIILAAVRMIAGPRAQDRVLALDALYVNTMLLFLTLGLRTGTVFFFEAAIVIAMLGFVATVALAKFLMRGEVIE